MAVDYSLYLVTDSTKAILGNKDIAKVVHKALEGGTTIVQYRDKTSETADLIRIGKRLHETTKNFNVPLLINDRVDVAIAVGAEGVHIGQDDMDLATARKLLGLDAIIGVTCSTQEEAFAAVDGGADYLGIGTIYATPTKENAKSIIGPSGTKAILKAISAMDRKVSTVAIGGINTSNVQRVMYQSKSTFKGLDGVAVVSAIMAADDPKQAAADLRELIGNPPSFAKGVVGSSASLEILLKEVPEIVREVGVKTPLCHNMTNLVVQNFAANVALAIGASPIMANYGEEAQDLAVLGGGLVVNMGTVTPDGLANFAKAIRAYNAGGGPVLFDPVGAGATRIRREAVKTLMSAGYFDLIKGNENEITTVLGETAVQQKGVDSSTSSSTGLEKARLVKKLAARERTIVLLTGATDYLSDGSRAYAIGNGDSYLGRITGSGCTLGTTIAAFLAVHREDKLLAALAGILMYEIAAERAGRREDVKGPGTFVPAFLDELNVIAKQAAMRNLGWMKGARVEEVDVSGG